MLTPESSGFRTATDSTAQHIPRAHAMAWNTHHSHTRDGLPAGHATAAHSEMGPATDTRGNQCSSATFALMGTEIPTQEATPARLCPLYSRLSISGRCPGHPAQSPVPA